jgi:hypothetical protein
LLCSSISLNHRNLLDPGSKTLLLLLLILLTHLNPFERSPRERSSMSNEVLESFARRETKSSRAKLEENPGLICILQKEKYSSILAN